MTIEYKLTERKNMHGKLCVAPWIGDWNVWDIPKKEYTPAVEEAIKRAYSIGLMHMRDRLIEAARDANDELRIKQ